MLRRPFMLAEALLIVIKFVVNISTRVSIGGLFRLKPSSQLVLLFFFSSTFQPRRSVASIGGLFRSKQLSIGFCMLIQQRVLCTLYLLRLCMHVQCRMFLARRLCSVKRYVRPLYNVYGDRHTDVLPTPPPPPPTYRA